MKTTVDIQDELLAQAERHARQTGRPLAALVEDGLRRVISATASTAPSDDGAGYRLPDCSVGDAGRPDPTQQYSWQDLRAMIYDDPERKHWTP